MVQWSLAQDKVTQYLVEMVRIDSVNPSLVPGAAGEAEMAAWLADTCARLGLDVETQEPEAGRPNVVARWQGSGGGRSLLLTGHTDTVTVESMEGDPFDARIEDGRLYGRGALDMKGGLAAILGAVDALQTGGFQPRGDVILGFVSDEEWTSVGTEALVERVQADAAILTEPTDMDIYVANKGFAALVITTRGRAAHGSRFDEGIDAIAHMGRVLNELEHMERETFPQRTHLILGRPSVHASFVEGGLGWSSYPDRCELKLEHRLLPGDSTDDVIALWEEVFERLKAEDSQFDATIKLDFARFAYEIERDAPIVQTLYAAIKAVAGDEPAYGGMTAWLDAALLGEAGIPTVVYGPGGEGLHAAVEYVNLDDVHRCALALAEATARWAG